MITQSMNRHEVVKHMCTDQTILRFMDRKLEEWRKALKKYPPKYYFGKAWEWHSKQTNQDFILCICKQNINDTAISLNAKVKGGRRNYIYTVNINDPECVHVFSTHFWNRYAERMDFLYSMPHIIAKFHARNPYQNAIYVNMDENRVVYATRDGIILCEIDQTRGLYLMRTFVSKEMLKDLQREAYDILDALTKRLDAYFSEAVRNKNVPLYQAMAQDFVKPFALQASDIYAKFWENDETEE